MKARALLAALLAAAAAAAHAERRTVCTVTVNSADEREAFRRHLPAERFDFVELVERGSTDWLAASCRKGVRCDVLLVSGHFAGTEFYSSRVDAVESLPVDALEKAACSDSCPGLFAQLREVYLFGCDTLNSTPVRVATPEMVRALQREGSSPGDAVLQAHALAERHGESALEHMRRLFAGVPVIYGFSSKAPYGRHAGPMLERHFRTGGSAEIGSGAVSERLRRLFAPASMVVTAGQGATEPNAGYREQACGFHDTRLSAAQKLAAIHRTLAGSMAEARLVLDRIEKFLGGLGEADRAEPGFAAALAAIAADKPLRTRFLDLARDTADPAVRIRLLALARELGWLAGAEHRAETLRMVGDVLASRSADYGEVELVCTLNRDGRLDGEGARLAGGAPARPATHAALACLGDPASRARTLDALASLDEADVQVAQAYLRHRPLGDGAELRAVALKVAAMPGGMAQARALEALARHHIADGEILEALERVFMRTRSLAVQRSVAEIYLRSGLRAEPALAKRLREHRVGGGNDVIDALIERLESS